MNIGFIGLGVMGFPMAGHLHKSKHNVAVFNRSSNKVEQWIKDYEGKAFKNIEDIAQFSDVIILCITKDQDVKEVLIKNQDFSNKLKEGKLKLISDFKISKPKTSFLTSKLVKMEIDSALFIDGVDVEKNFKHAVRNIPKTDFLPISGINVYDIIRRNFLVISEKALLGINERFKNE